MASREVLQLWPQQSELEAAPLAAELKSRAAEAQPSAELQRPEALHSHLALPAEVQPEPSAESQPQLAAVAPQPTQASPDAELELAARPRASVEQVLKEVQPELRLSLQSREP